MSKIELQPSATALWHALVNDAESAANHHLDQEVESYLVFLLIRHSDRPEIAQQVLALDYLEAIHHGGKRREAALRQVADSSLLYAGLFPQQVQRKRVSADYFVNLGRSAYLQLSEITLQSIASLYNKLADTFVQLMDILSAIRGFTQHPQHRELLRLHELWQKTGSAYSLQQIQELQPEAVVSYNRMKIH